ncbi:MAG: Nif3-like dinuclear metal center hexameric protein [Planctomycetes bacterium]|nr:Nif3-like dinuclear metal center hexameric protein [Planctomycetota bacterium]
MSKAPSLAEVLDLLHEIAPLELAADWDNTGLLLEPKRRRGPVRRALLAVDLTEAVVAEAVAWSADLLVTYHPPIFHGQKRLRSDDGRQRVLLAAIAAGCAVYSPHTALDAAPSGLAEWLAEGVLAGAEPDDIRPCGEGEFGRWVKLPRAVPFAELLRRVARRLRRSDFAVARGTGVGNSVRTVAVAAGAGAGVLRGCRADVWITGELPHHDVLAAVADGTSVVLAGHSHTERPYLPVLGRRLTAAFGKALAVRVSRADRDPLAIVRTR